MHHYFPELSPGRQKAGAFFCAIISEEDPIAMEASRVSRLANQR
jgi:hypothetical protein